MNYDALARTQALEAALRNNARRGGGAIALEYDADTGTMVPVPVQPHPTVGATRVSPCIVRDYGCEEESRESHPVEIYGMGTGLIETDIFKDKTVLMIGVGSVGADIALQLALAGVGGLILCDPDTVEASNLSRLRDCVIGDIGRRKADVIGERILGHNPQCHVQSAYVDVTSDTARLASMVAEADVVVCTTDNRVSRHFAATALEHAERRGVFVRCSTRAESGDVFISRPGSACWGCMFGSADIMPDDIDDFAAMKKAGKLAAYMRPDDIGKYSILPGLYSDITAITSFAAKAIFWLLGESLPANPFEAFEGDVFGDGFNYFIFVNRRERLYADWASFGAAGSRPCTNRWYGARIERNGTCRICGSERNKLDTAEYLEGIIKELILAGHK